MRRASSRILFISHLISVLLGFFCADAIAHSQMSLHNIDAPQFDAFITNQLPKFSFHWHRARESQQFYEFVSALKSTESTPISEFRLIANYSDENFTQEVIHFFRVVEATVGIVRYSDKIEFVLEDFALIDENCGDALTFGSQSPRVSTVFRDFAIALL